MEMLVILTHLTGRTLVLPDLLAADDLFMMRPPVGLWDFYDFEHLREWIPVISMDQYLDRRRAPFLPDAGLVSSRVRLYESVRKQRDAAKLVVHERRAVVCCNAVSAAHLLTSCQQLRGSRFGRWTAGSSLPTMPCGPTQTCCASTFETEAGTQVRNAVHSVTVQGPSACTDLLGLPPASSELVSCHFAMWFWRNQAGGPC